MHLPAQIGDYTDFYCCQEHAKNAAAIKTGVRVLSPNWYAAVSYGALMHAAHKLFNFSMFP